MSVQLNPTAQTQVIKPSQTVSQPAVPTKGQWQDVQTGKFMTEDEFILQIKNEKSHRNRDNAIKAISTLGGLAGGTGVMLASKTVPGMLVGMGIMGAGLLIPRVIDGKGVGEGAVAFVGGGVSIGIGAAVGLATKNPLLGGLAAGAAVLGTIALSKSLKD